tara:strand:+ start:3813 stop:5021 length:1209 start_codon:yes stop_codon:yes gene_type:complete
MANAFTVSQLVAAKSQDILKGQIVAGNLFNNDIEQNFGKNPKTGNTVKVNRRPVLTPTERTLGANVNIQDIDETVDSFVLEKELETTITIDPYDLTLSVDAGEIMSADRIRSFMDNQVSRIVSPVAVGFAEKLDANILAKVDDVPSAYPTTASLALPSTLSDFNAISTVLNKKKVPMSGRFGIVTPDLYGSMLDLLTKVNESGNSDALRNGIVGRLATFDVFMDQHFPEDIHTTGIMGTAVVNNVGGYPAGTTSIAFDTGDQAVGTFLTGDTLTIAGYGNVIVAADVTAVANAGVVTIKEPLRETILDDAAITNYGVAGGVSITYKTVGFFGVRDCIAYASIPPVVQGENFDSTSFSEDGFGVTNTIRGDSGNLNTLWTMNTIPGYKMLDGRLGVKVVQKLS